MTSAVFQHIYNPRTCALACEPCARVRLEAMAIGLFGPKPRRTLTAAQPRAPLAQMVTLPSAAATTRAQMTPARPQPLLRSKRIAIPGGQPQAHRICKPAQTKPRRGRTLPSPSPTPDAANVEKIVLRLRWTPVLVIPAREAEDQKIRAGSRRLILDPEWREQKIRSWTQDRA